MKKSAFIVKCTENKLYCTMKFLVHFSFLPYMEKILTRLLKRKTMREEIEEINNQIDKKINMYENYTIV